MTGEADSRGLGWPWALMKRVEGKLGAGHSGPGRRECGQPAGERDASEDDGGGGLMLLGWILTIGLAASVGGACPPAALLGGDAGARQRLAVELEHRGVTVAPPSGCPAVRVDVTEAGPRIRLAMIDPQGRTAQREAASPGVAAAFVESWSRADLSDPLLEMPPAPAAARPARGSLLSVAAHLETGLDSDAGGWVGVGVGLLVLLGPICLGPEAALRGQPLAAGGEHPQVRRARVDLALSAGLRGLKAGRIHFVPTLGLGFGWMRSESADPRRSAEPERRGGPRAQAAVAIAVPVGQKLWLEARFSATLMPLGRGEDRPNLPELLPDDPWGLFAAGLGLRWGTI
jgi:hypothetical protein